MAAILAIVWPEAFPFLSASSATSESPAQHLRNTDHLSLPSKSLIRAGWYSLDRADLLPTIARSEFH